MKASLRPALFVLGAATLCGVALLNTASASSVASTLTPETVELGHKDGGAAEALFVTGHKDGGAVELITDKAGKDAGAVDLMFGAEKGGKDGGYVTAAKSDAGK
jgi:hypothetical protein